MPAIIVTLQLKTRATAVGLHIPAAGRVGGTRGDDASDDGDKLALGQLALQCFARGGGQHFETWQVEEFVAIRIEQRDRVCRIGKREATHRLHPRMARPVGQSHHELAPLVTIKRQLREKFAIGHWGFIS